MSKRGEIVPELAAMLRDIADRIEAGSAGLRDADAIRKLADQAEGIDGRWMVKVHRTNHAPAHGAAGVDRRFAMALAVKEYRDANKVTLAVAYAALDGKFGVGPDYLKKAWGEMRSIVAMPDRARRFALFFLRIQANQKAGAAKRNKKATPL